MTAQHKTKKYGVPFDCRNFRKHKETRKYPLHAPLLGAITGDDDLMHTGSFSQKSFQIDVIIECGHLKICHFCFIIVEIPLNKNLKLIRVMSGLILKKIRNR